MKNLFASYADDNMLFFDEYSGTATFCFNQVGILCLDLHNISLNDTNYDEDNPAVIIHIRLLTWDIKLEKCKGLKNDMKEELMLSVWHPKR